ncbi:MAG: hypothetical protein JO004_02195 [Methylobacteriaceae bacterium]|nr:hypothetical protein [Methylobacteriaceae bacterium]
MDDFKGGEADLARHDASGTIAADDDLRLEGEGSGLRSKRRADLDEIRVLVNSSDSSPEADVATGIEKRFRPIRNKLVLCIDEMPLPVWRQAAVVQNKRLAIEAKLSDPAPATAGEDRLG